MPKKAETKEGAFCERCWSTLRYTKTDVCVSCRKQTVAKYNAKPSTKTYFQDYYKNNKPKWSTYNSLPSTKEANRVRMLAYYHDPKNHERILAYHAANRKTEKWKDTHRVSVNKNRARRRKAPGSYTKAQWVELKAKYDNRCLACKKHQTELDRPLEQDHILPITKGGTNYIWNIQPLCHECNGPANKGTRYIDYRPPQDRVAA